MTNFDRPPHVLYVLTGYPVLSQTFVRNEVQALRATGMEVTVVAFRRSDADRIDPAWAGPYTTLPDPSWLTALRDLLWWAVCRPRRFARMVALTVSLRGRGVAEGLRRLPGHLRHLDKQGIQAVHSHFGWRGTAPCLYAGVMLSAPTSVTLHADDIYAPAADLGRKLRLFSHLVTVCDFNVPITRRLAGPEVPISVVPCGVDVPSSPPSPPVPGRVLSVGRLVNKKGFPDLVAAMDEVARTHPDAQLEIIGEGMLREQLEEQIARSSHPDRIRLLSSLPNDQVLEKMSSCSLFVLACRRQANGGSDALPVVIREAMARARPVVSTDIAGIPETLEGVGWVVPSEDVSALAKAITEALDDPERAAELGRAARERTLHHYTLAHTAAGMRAVFGIDGPLSKTKEH